MTTTIADLTNGVQLDGLLKDVYLPTLTETVFNDDRFTRLIERTSDNIDYEGQRVKHTFETQRSAGVGAIAEGGQWVRSVPVKGQQGSETIKYLNAYLELTGPVIEAARSDRGTVGGNIVTRHFRTNIVSARNNMERMLMGAADGVIGTLTDADPTGTASGFDGRAYFDTQHVEPGMWIEVRAPVYGAAALRELSAGVPAITSIVSATKGDRATATRGTITTAAPLDAAGNTVAQGDWVCREGAWDPTGTVCQEINGLRNLISDGVADCGFGDEDTPNFATAWGLSRAANPYLISHVQNVNAELTEDILLDVLLVLENQNQATPNLFLCTPRALKEYFLNEVGTAGAGIRRFNTVDAMEWVGGYTGAGIQLGSTKLMLTALPSVPYKHAFVLNTNDFAFAQMGTDGFRWVLGDSNNVLVQSHGRDTKFASAVCYMQFVCYDPGRQAKLYNVVEL